MSNFSNMFQEFMKNPEMLKQSLNMLQNNPGMMEQFKTMSKAVQDNPDILNNFMGGFNKTTSELKINDKVITKNLKNIKFNNLTGVIEEYCKETNRYFVNISELNKKLSIKKENLELINDESIPIEIE